MEWTCHYIVPFASCDSFDLKFILCDISINIPDIAFFFSFLAVITWDILSHALTINQLVFLGQVSFL